MWGLSKISRSTETAEMLERRPVDIFCIQKTRLKGKSVRITSGKATEYKLLWIGNEKHFRRIKNFLVKKWVDKVIDIKSDLLSTYGKFSEKLAFLTP